jgi:U-box domain/Sel1 repeat
MAQNIRLAEALLGQDSSWADLLPWSWKPNIIVGFVVGGLIFFFFKIANRRDVGPGVGNDDDGHGKHKDDYRENQNSMPAGSKNVGSQSMDRVGVDSNQDGVDKVRVGTKPQVIVQHTLYQYLCKYRKNCPTDDLICPITLELPWDPVVASDGRVYDRPAIEEHLECRKGQLKSPITNKELLLLMDSRLLPAPQIKYLIGTLVEIGVIGGYLASKWNEKVKEQKRVEDLLKKAQGGDAEAMYRVGISYLTGTCGFEEDEKLAVKWFTKSHEAGYVQGTAALGYYLCNGHGVAKCHSTGIAYLGIAAAQGSKYAAYVLGIAWADGKYGMNVNKFEAIYWLEKATSTADQSEKDIQFKRW